MRSPSIFIGCLILLFSISIFSQDNNHFPERGLYRPVKPLPKEFNDICELQIKFKKGENDLTAKPDRNGKIPIVGLIRTGQIFLLKKSDNTTDLNAFINSKCRNSIEYYGKNSALSNENTYFDMKFFDRLEFTTFSKKGISYKFTGNFLGKPRLEGGKYIHLEGTLVKIKKGLKIAETKIKFIHWVYL